MEGTQDLKRLIADILKFRDACCAHCAGALCGHAVLFSIALGSGSAPRCQACLAAALGREPREMCRELVDYIGSKECTRAAWLWTQEREAACPLGSEAFGPAQAAPGVHPLEEAMMTAAGPDHDLAVEPTHHAAWDAGDLGCGELVLELRTRLALLEPGQIFKLTAIDRGAPHDLPAWCRMTGNTLARADHPEYWIRRKP